MEFCHLPEHIVLRIYLTFPRFSFLLYMEAVTIVAPDRVAERINKMLHDKYLSDA